MTKRSLWLVVIGFLLPGSAQILTGNRKLGRIGLIATIVLIVGALLTALGFAAARSATLNLFTNSAALFVLQWLLVAYAILWLVLGFDTLRLTQLVRITPNWRIPVAVIAVVLTVLPSLGVGWASSTIGSTRSLLSGLFQGSPAVDPVDGRYNILLLGTDAGADRDGMRPDSISLVSVDAKTGQSVIIGLPRELTEMPFPEESPMYNVHPNGFCIGPNSFGDGGGCLTGYLNGVYAELEQADVIVESEGLDPAYASLYEGFYADAASRGSSPGLEATKDAVSGATGLDVQFFVLVNMDAFENLINALGGVDINVQERLPIGGDQFGNGVEGYIEIGQQHMDGFTAQWYARSRYGSENGDYARMERQRELQGAILAQMNPKNVLTRFQDIAAAGTELVETDIPESMLGRFLDLAAKAREHSPVNVELVPPAIDPELPDYARAHQLVADGVAAASPSDPESVE
ncbi:LCP family protein required for cell wall assembly [Leucobacter exalbidus]|uniref:LCP family protein required for cell wall assembly n=1 Tax=Leucobacter exalbidus TaxID=662960 RepID=A0A940T0P8_9MICO|nr:LCP family protein [Leucobacter exalbidus]MBP1326100.1 LCP family protein required for cell wall assembly [Leucobacter exalbidus]